MKSQMVSVLKATCKEEEKKKKRQSELMEAEGSGALWQEGSAAQLIQLWALCFLICSLSRH